MTLMNARQVGKRPAKQASLTRKPSIPSAKASKPRVLVVEDEIFVAWHLEAALRDLDCAVCDLVPDGESAVDRAACLHADLVLMDINLQGTIDGVEAARRIREHADTPVIFITAYSDPATLRRIRELVPDAPVLAKPISPGVLKRAVSVALADATA
jgi:CheY-like chemotaxis protein